LKRYGVPHPSQAPEFQEKIRKTSLERYGYESPNQSPEVQDRASKTALKVVQRMHWDTGEVLYCRGGYEPPTVDLLNERKENFKWQPTVFRIPMDKMTTKKGRQATYRPDLYLPNRNLWVEIKGWLDRDLYQKDKWLWFHDAYPNSELWEEKQLREMGVELPKYKSKKKPKSSP